MPGGGRVIDPDPARTSTGTAVRPSRIVVISETDTRDVRIAKQLHALEVLGHDVHLIAPDAATGAFVRVQGGFTTIPRTVHGMTLPAEGEDEDGAVLDGRWRPWHLLPVPLRRAAGGALDRARGRIRVRRHDRALRAAARAAEVLAPDLVMLHRTRPAIAILGRRSFRPALRAPVVVDLHELPSQLHGQRFASLARSSDRRETRRLLAALRRARLVTSEELNARHLAAEFGLVTVELPNLVLSPDVGSSAGAPGERQASDRLPSLRQRLGLGPDVRLVAYLGFYRSGRGVERLIAATASLPEHYHLALVVGWTGRALREVIGQSSAASRVHLVDLLPQHELAVVLQSVDLGVYVPDMPDTPHAQLCTPTKLYELHAAGVPVLVAADPGLREFADRYGGAVVLDRPVTPEGLARAIEDVVEGRLTPSVRRPTPDLTDVMQRVLAAAGL
jgi:glycosyltransferase involved in cell wall biosynthesis